jgi:hypothetical protein
MLLTPYHSTVYSGFYAITEPCFFKSINIANAFTIYKKGMKHGAALSRACWYTVTQGLHCATGLVVRLLWAFLILYLLHTYTLAASSIAAKNVERSWERKATWRHHRLTQKNSSGESLTYGQNLGGEPAVQHKLLLRFLVTFFEDDIWLSFQNTF